MDTGDYLARLGMLIWIGGMFFLVVLIYSQERLLAKWEANEKKWVTRGHKGFGVRLIKENNPPRAFEEEFQSRPLRKYGWIGYVILAGFAVMVIFGR